MVNVLNLALCAAGVFASLATATNLHVNVGCVNVNSQPVCSGNGNPIAVSGSTATIQGRFSGNTALFNDVAGCVLQATWPASYGDIYYGYDNCLYDGNGNNIGGQCCTSGGGASVRNPYNYYYG